ncbi:acryloyl-CoA reductase electron transfer subunit gamma [mine drainage metagenome]|uniref:Acryloyl-CoA reductase electron transfer subunit gamma n=1 Tax=mine drainage metagenome TaxID=410659 RepID=A0A1J5PVV6_9ZZZZ
MDIVFTGKQTIDGDTAQVGPGIAKRLGLQLLTYVSRIIETDLEKRTITVERRAEGGVQVLKTALPCLITMLENTNEMRFAALPAMIHAAAYPVRKWSKEDAGIEDLDKIGLKGSPTVVSKVFGPTQRTDKAEMLSADTAEPRDIALNLVQMIFTRQPALEQDLLSSAAA